MATRNLGDLLFMNRKHADVIFVVDGEEFPGHRAIISEVWPHLEKLLNGQFMESNFKKVEVEEASPKVFQEVIRFIYKGQLEVSDWTVEELLTLLALAKSYEFQELFEKVVEHLNEKSLDFNSWALVSDVAALNDSNALRGKCISSAESKIEDFIRKIDLDKFTVQFICAMFESPNLPTWNQDKVLSALLMWINGQSEAQVLSLFQKICWKKVSPDISSTIVEEFFSTVDNAEKCKCWTNCVTRWHQALNGIARVDRVSLLKGHRIEYARHNNSGTFFCELDALGLKVSFNKGRLWLPENDIPVKSIEFESETYLTIKRISGSNCKLRPFFMVVSEPTMNNGWFKYNAAFSCITPLFSMYIELDNFEKIRELSLRNFVIYT